MSTTSITQAVIDKYESLTAANFPSGSRPRIDYGLAAQVVLSVQERPPFTVLRDVTRRVKIIDFERNALVNYELELRVYAGTLADVDTIVTAIRLNGGTVGQGLGFDYGTLSTLGTPKSTHQIIPLAEPRKLEDLQDNTGARIHGCSLSYRVAVLEAA